MRRRTLLLALGLAALLFPGLPALGTDAVNEAWRQRIAEAHHAVAEAHQRAEAAHNTYQDWRQRKYPRGVRKKELLREVDLANEAVRDAEARFAGLLEEARRDGVPPGVLRAFE